MQKVSYFKIKFYAEYASRTMRSEIYTSPGYVVQSHSNYYLQKQTFFNSEFSVLKRQVLNAFVVSLPVL
jgi:hypothetical protein